MEVTHRDDVEKARIRDEITSLSNMDMVAIVLRESFGALPVIGAGLTELINVAIPNSSFDRLVDFTINLRVDLTRLGDRINKEYVRTDAGAFMVREIITEVRDNYQKEKLDALRGAFLNSVITSNRDDERKELYLNLLEGMTQLHLRILSLCANPVEFGANRHMALIGFRGSLIQTLEACLPEMDWTQISSVWNGLHNWGLVDGDVNSPMPRGGSDITLPKLKLKLTEFGKDFVAFITIP